MFVHVLYTTIIVTYSTKTSELAEFFLVNETLLGRIFQGFVQELYNNYIDIKEGIEYIHEVMNPQQTWSV